MKTIKAFTPYIILAVGISAVLALTLSAGGCAQVRDIVAQAIGAPTQTQVDQAKKELADAASKQQVLADQVSRMESERTTALQQQQNAQASAKAAQQTLAQLGAQLAQAEPGSVAWNALAAAYDQTKGQVGVFLGQADQAAQVVLLYGRKLVEAKSAIDTNARLIGETRSKLDQYDQDLKSAIAGAGDAVTQAGRTAGDLGVPGVGALSGAVGAGLTGILGVIFGVRQKSAAVAATADAAQAKTAAADLAGSIESAKVADPTFAQALAKVAPILNQYQGDAAKAVVDQVQGKSIASGKEA